MSCYPYLWNDVCSVGMLTLCCHISLKLQKENTEDYIDYLISIGWLDEAALRLADVINDDSFVSKDGKSKHQVCRESMFATCVCHLSMMSYILHVHVFYLYFIHIPVLISITLC